MKLSFILFTFLMGQMTMASDHIDGAPSLTNGQADLTDLYSFQTPHKNNNLTVILNTYPGVGKEGHFSSKVKYQIQIRPISLNTPSEIGLYVFNYDVLNLDCSFTDPDHHWYQKNKKPSQVECELLKDQNKVAEIAGSVGETLENDDLKLFTGPRSDGFFLSTEHFGSVTDRKGFPEENPQLQDAMYSINILTLTVEINLETLNIEPQLFGISAQSLDAENNVTIDRVGRPEITNLSLHAFGDAKKIKRSYNQKPHFAVAEEFQNIFKERLSENISAYDQLDNIQDWSQDDLEALTQILVNDFQLVDLSQNCSFESPQYLSIEKSLLGLKQSNACGGRKPSEDIMSAMYALYIGGLKSDFANYRTGVNVPYQNNDQAQLSNQFPYLAKPSKTTLKQTLLLKLLMSLQE